MILYWAWPTDGAGHAVRAAAICRHLTDEFVVIRGIEDPVLNRALNHFDIPYIVMPSRQDAMRWALGHSSQTLILDDAAGSVLDRKAKLYIWRLGRPPRPNRPMPTIRLEGPGAIGPVLMLEDDEILSKEEAREDLGLPRDKFLRIGVPSSNRPGLVETQRVDYMLEEWPALRWMRAADHIVGAIGANLYGEVSYLGLPATWVMAPHVRDQSVRVGELPHVVRAPNAARKIAKIITDLQVP